MTEITATMVKELRERTGAGMMECKKALVEAKGDIKQAEEIIAKSGHKKVAKSAGRTAAEGKIVIASTHNRAVMLEINCETDFVARDENFSKFAQQISDIALTKKLDDMDQLVAAQINNTTVEQTRQELIARLGENIQVRRIQAIDASSSQKIGAYVHLTRIGALVLIEGGTDELAKDLAMHIAAMKPQYIAFEDVPADIVAKEKEIQMVIAEKSGKPANIIEKIVAGQLQKKFNEICLLGQAFFKDPDQSIGQYLSKNKASVKSFTRFEVGEGIEVIKKSFEEEVMEQARGK